MLRPVCSATDFTAEMIGAARWFLRKEGFQSLIGHPSAVSLAFAVIFPG
jgi:hypothetical protein